MPAADLRGADGRSGSASSGAVPRPRMRLLFLEDVPEDAELEQRALRRAGISFEALRVDDRAGLMHALEGFHPDLVIADYRLPDIDGLTAIRLVRQWDVNLPVLLVTGALDDEAAAEVVKAGAYDYLRKDRLSRLPIAIENALAAAEAVKARRAAERLEVIGELTAGVAHDFNNLLQAIISNLESVDDVAGVPAAARECVDSAIGIAEHGAELIRKLLSFARKQVMHPSRVEVGDFLAELSTMLRRVLDPRIRLAATAETGLPPVLVDPTHLHTALLNLAINARDAMPSGGHLRIEAMRGRAADAGVSDPADTDQVALIRVADTGTGMSPEVLAKACEPFFSTKGLHGTGLGLPMVYGFAKQSGGDLRIFSEPGSGTRVELWLPLAPVEECTRAASRG
jgi:signal transduction histidine kinase